jgi:AbrB family looped-hinge helix DNA binding protein
LRTIGDSKLSSKFQATIPKSVREFLKLEAGDLILFVRDDGSILLKRGELRVKG